MVYLERERILIEADAFVPNASLAPFAPNLLRNVNAREWRVDRIVPLHGDVVDFAELEQAADGEAKRI